jgi:hypothetical protein
MRHQYLILLSAQFKYLLEDVGVRAYCFKSESGQVLSSPPSVHVVRFDPVPEARCMLGRCFVKRSLRFV